MRIVPKVRDWTDLMPSTVGLKNAYKERKAKNEADEEMKVPQSFTFMAREGAMLLCEKLMFTSLLF